MNLPVNTLLQGGKYKIVRFISSGGFGCTYEAEHVMLEKKVAIKEFFVKDFCNRDEQTAHVTVGTLSKKGLVEKLRRKFIDEAKGLCKLHHPGIVSVSDVFEENGTAYFVMDYIEGKSLSEIVHARGALPEKQALDYIRQAGEALQYVHEHNRLHLDVKPANIMLDAAGNAVLIDFGASKQYDEADGENTSTLIGKTPGYAPLEQMGNDVVKFMPATDVYALGATLYKLLTGKTPPSANLLATGEDLPPLPARISQEVRQAIESAMQTRKDKRPQSVREFLALLDSNGERPTEESDHTIFGETTKFVEKPRVEPSPSPTSIPTGEQKPKKGKMQVVVFIVVLVVSIGGYNLFIRGGFEKETNEQVVVAEEVRTVTEETHGTINGHEWVDLGLPSGVKWATCNVGANSPEDYGDYFAWGETQPKENYDWSTYKWCNGTYDSQNKYCTSSSYGIVDNKKILEASDDATYVQWGSGWRMPTLAELKELKNKCTWTWTTQNGVNGKKVTGPNGNSIFLPAAGSRYDGYLDDAGSYGHYWSGSLSESYPDIAYSLGFNSDYYDWYNFKFRYAGFTVRAVVR